MIRIFVGCAGNAEDAESQCVLEYRLRTLSSLPIEIEWMRLTRDKASFWSGWNSSGWATPFTAFRWGIPAFCGFKGRAIYMDSDMIPMADIAELWQQDIPLSRCMLVRSTEGKLRTCVILFDCERARDLLPICSDIKKLKGMASAHKEATSYLQQHRDIVGAFDGAWNSIDLKGVTGLDDPTLKMIHYSSMPNQVHLKYARARLEKEGKRHWYDGDTGPHWRPELQELFDRLYAEAQAAGYTVDRYLPKVPYGDYRKRSYAEKPLRVKTG